MYKKSALLRDLLATVSTLTLMSIPSTLVYAGPAARDVLGSTDLLIGTNLDGGTPFISGSTLTFKAGGITATANIPPAGTVPPENNILAVNQNSFNSTLAVTENTLLGSVVDTVGAGRLAVTLSDNKALTLTGTASTGVGFTNGATAPTNTYTGLGTVTAGANSFLNLNAPSTLSNIFSNPSTSATLNINQNISGTHHSILSFANINIAASKTFTVDATGNNVTIYTKNFSFGDAAANLNLYGGTGGSKSFTFLYTVDPLIDGRGTIELSNYTAGGTLAVARTSTQTLGTPTNSIGVLKFTGNSSINMNVPAYVKTINMNSVAQISLSQPVIGNSDSSLIFNAPGNFNYIYAGGFNIGTVDFNNQAGIFWANLGGTITSNITSTGGVNGTVRSWYGGTYKGVITNLALFDMNSGAFASSFGKGNHSIKSLLLNNAETTFEDGFNLTGNINQYGGAPNSNLTFIGTSTIIGNIGSAPVKNINIAKVGGGGVLEVQGTVDATSINFTQGGNKFRTNNNLTSGVAFTTPGTVEMFGTNTLTITGTFSGAELGNSTLNISTTNTNVTASSTAGNVGTTNIGTMATPSSYTISATTADATLSTINFLNADSTLKLTSGTATANRTFNLTKVINPGTDIRGILELNSSSANGTLSVTGQDIGTSINRLNILNLTGTNSLSVAQPIYVKNINVNTSNTTTFNNKVITGADGKLKFNSPGTVQVIYPEATIGTVDFNNQAGVFSMSASGTFTGNVTSTGGIKGTLRLLSGANFNGVATNLDILIINSSGIASSIGAGDHTINDITLTKANVTFADGFNLTGNIRQILSTNPSDITFSGNSTIIGSIGTFPVNNINIAKAGGGGTVEVQGTVAATSINFTQAGNIFRTNKNITSNIAFNAAGMLEIFGNYSVTIKGSVIGAKVGASTLNISNSNLTFNSSTVGQIGTINIGTASQPSTINIDITNGDIDLLNGTKINFVNPGSTLSIYSVSGVRNINLYNNLNGGGDLNGNLMLSPNSTKMTVNSIGGATIGISEINRLSSFSIYVINEAVINPAVYAKNINIIYNGVVTFNNVINTGAGGNLTFASNGGYAKFLNNLTSDIILNKSATLEFTGANPIKVNGTFSGTTIASSSINITTTNTNVTVPHSAALIGTTNIGTIASPASYTVDVTAENTNLLDNTSINFINNDSVFQIINNGPTSRIVTLKNNFDPGADLKGNVTVTNSPDTVFFNLTSSTTQTLGTALHRLKQLNTNNNNDNFNITAPIYAQTININGSGAYVGIGPINGGNGSKIIVNNSYNGPHLNGHMQLNILKTTNVEVIDFNNKKVFLGFSPDTTFMGNVTSSHGGPIGIISFYYDNISFNGVITNIATLLTGSGTAYIGPGEHVIGQIDGRGDKALTLANGFNLTGNINETLGEAYDFSPPSQPLPLIFMGNSTIRGNIGAYAPVGEININHVGGGGVVDFQGTVAATSLNFTKADNKVRINNSLTANVTFPTAGTLEFYGTNNLIINNVFSGASIGTSTLNISTTNKEVTATSPTALLIGTTNIGTNASPSTYIIDATNGDGTIQNINLLNANSILKLTTGNSAVSRTFTFNQTLKGSGDGIGRLDLNSLPAAGGFTLAATNDATVGVSNTNRLSAFNITGTGAATVTLPVYAQNINLNNTGSITFVNGIDTGAGGNINFNVNGANAIFNGNITSGIVFAQAGTMTLKGTDPIIIKGIFGGAAIGDSTLNINTSELNATTLSSSAASIGITNIGTAQAPALYVINATDGDIALLNNTAINFLHPDSYLVLSAGESGLGRVFTLYNNLSGGSDGIGRVELHSSVAGGGLTLDSAGARTLGTALNRLITIILTGDSNININVPVYAQNIIVSNNGQVTFNKEINSGANSNLIFNSNDVNLTFEGNTTISTIDFSNTVNSLLNISNEVTLTSNITSTGGQNGIMNFTGNGTFIGDVNNIEAINIAKAGGGAIVDLQGNITAGSINYTQADNIVRSNNMLDADVAFTNRGTLELYGNNPIILNSKFSGGGLGTSILNISTNNTNITSTSITSGLIGTLNIGTALAPSSFTFDVTDGDLTILNGTTINLMHADSTLAFTNAALVNRKITVGSNFDPGANLKGRVEINASPQSPFFQITNNNNATLGTAINRLNTLNINNNNNNFNITLPLYVQNININGSGALVGINAPIDGGPGSKLTINSTYAGGDEFFLAVGKTNIEVIDFNNIATKIEFYPDADSFSGNITSTGGEPKGTIKFPATLFTFNGTITNIAYLDSLGGTASISAGNHIIKDISGSTKAFTLNLADGFNLAGNISQKDGGFPINLNFLGTSTIEGNIGAGSRAGDINIGGGVAPAVVTFKQNNIIRAASINLLAGQDNILSLEGDTQLQAPVTMSAPGSEIQFQGNITITETIDAHGAGGNGLITIADNANIEFKGKVGNTLPIKDLNVGAKAKVTLSAEAHFTGELELDNNSILQISNNISAAAIGAKVINNQSILEFINNDPIVIDSRIGNAQPVTIIKIAGSDVTLNGKVYPPTIFQFTSNLPTVLTLNQPFDLADNTVTTVGNDIHTIKLRGDQNITGKIGTSEEFTLASIKLLDSDTVNINTVNFYSGITAADGKQVKVNFIEPSGKAFVYNMGDYHNSLLEVNFVQNGQVKGNIFAKKVNIDPARTAIFAGKANVPIKDILNRYNLNYSLTLNDRERIMRVAKIEELNLKGAGSEAIFEDNTFVYGTIRTLLPNEGKVVFKGNAFVPTIGLKEAPVGNISFVGNKTNTQFLTGDLYATTITTSNTTLQTQQNMTLQGNLTGENTTFNIRNNVVTCEGQTSLTGEVVFKAMIGGEDDPYFYINEGSKFDFSQASSATIIYSSRLQAPLDENTMKNHILFRPVNSNRILTPSQVNITQEGSSIVFTGVYNPITGAFLIANTGSNNNNSGGNTGNNGGNNVGNPTVPIPVSPTPESGFTSQELAAALSLANSLRTLAVINDNPPAAATENQVETLIEAVYTATRGLDNRLEAVRAIAVAGDMGIAAGANDNLNSHGAWFSPFYDIADHKAQEFAGGYTTKCYGLTLGIDTKLNDNLTLGTALSIVKTDVQHKEGRENDTAKTDSWMFSLYGSKDLTENLFIDSTASISFNTAFNKEQREVDGEVQEARSRYKFKAYNIEISGGYKLKLSPQFSLIPYVGISYDYAQGAKFNETGARTLNYAVKVYDYDRVEGLVGSRLIYEKTMDKLTISPEIFGYVYYGFNNKSQKIDARLINTDITRHFQLDKPARVSYALGTTLNAKYKIFEVGGQYELGLAKKYKSHQGIMKLRIIF